MEIDARRGRRFLVLSDTAKTARAELIRSALHSVMTDLVPCEDLKVDTSTINNNVYIFPGSSPNRSSQNLDLCC